MEWGKHNRLRGRAEQRGHASESWPWPGPLGTSRGWATAQNLSPPPKQELDFHTQPYSHWLQPSQKAPLLSVPVQRAPAIQEWSWKKQQMQTIEAKHTEAVAECFTPVKEMQGLRANLWECPLYRAMWKVNTLENLKRSFPEYSKESVIVTFIDSSQVNFLLAINKPRYSGISTQLFTQKRQMSQCLNMLVFCKLAVSRARSNSLQRFFTLMFDSDKTC